MSKAELCPVCKGCGKIFGHGDAGTCPTETCHGCDGKEWVEVSDNFYPILPPQSLPSYPMYPVVTWTYSSTGPPITEPIPR